MTVPTTRLPSGDELPVVGKGTYELEGETVQEPVETALDVGYTHVDTAEGYMNEPALGEVLAEHDREEVFLTSKVLAKHLNYESVIESAKQTLSDLGTDYLDLYLIHWPNPAISVRETMDAMATLKEQGLVRNVGVSNFDTYQLSAAMHVSDVAIAVNQIEFHPYLQRPDLLEYCREHDITVEAAAPLARTKVLDDPVIEELAEKYDRTPAQIVLRWATEKDVVVLPRSTSREHIEQNVDLFEFELDEPDHARIDDLDRDEAVYDTRTREWDDDVWGMAE
ncbi:25-diketo-D-gluconic acid reductase protein [Halorhabdus tiamatea SARL4B]|uniref:25-diketo-D-gluconic acid reductase protein n=1 Tax=Halorhabdus tiamatea SARL4B TaxID=1033806 RepID=F7PH13_9EURY|nr:aldo/keto reductase [Halorhabdus tiamatea]ERJ04848.1 25-diketo-D-gluconic acid reductase protein [Halorhabdus tiamatea SARL4B]CCQ32855.1 aldo/keto reductase family oxidoreductase [Halorhabdus tiamatea SARL4B]